MREYKRFVMLLGQSLLVLQTTFQCKVTKAQSFQFCKTNSKCHTNSQLIIDTFVNV